MPLTAQQIAYKCLEYLGEFNLTLVEYTGDAAVGVYRSIALAITAAQSEMFSLNPLIFKREVGAGVRAPITGTVGVTNGSTAVSATSFSAPMHSNTILIGGQSEYNAIRTEGGVQKLLFPFTGPTGTQAATLYGDAILLDPAYSQPLSPVWLSDIRILSPLAGKADLLGFDPRQDLNDDWGRLPFGSSQFPKQKLVAQPEAFLVDTHLLEAGTSQVRIFLTPIPERVYSLRFDAAVSPVDVTMADLGTEGSDPLRYFGLPGKLDAEYLLPLVLYHWSNSAFFKNAEARRQIIADYQSALLKIEAYKVQQQTGGHVVTRGWR